MGQLCGERRNVRQRWLASEWKGAAVFADGLSGAVASGLGKVRYLNWLGRGVCQRRLNKYKRIASASAYRVTHPKQKLKRMLER